MVELSSLDPRLSIRNLNAAELTCNVVTGKSNETNVVIRSYCPTSALINWEVKMGVINTDTALGRNVAKDSIAVFFTSSFFLLIICLSIA